MAELNNLKSWLVGIIIVALIIFYRHELNTAPSCGNSPTMNSPVTDSIACVHYLLHPTDFLAPNEKQDYLQAVEVLDTAWGIDSLVEYIYKNESPFSEPVETFRDQLSKIALQRNDKLPWIYLASLDAFKSAMLSNKFSESEKRDCIDFLRKNKKNDDAIRSFTVSFESDSSDRLLKGDSD